MNDVTGLPTVGRNMVKEGDFTRLVGMCLHAFRFVNDDKMLILIEAVHQLRLTKGNGLLRIIVFIEKECKLITGSDGILPATSLSI